MKPQAPLLLAVLAAMGCAPDVNNNNHPFPPAAPAPLQQPAAPDKRIVIDPTLQPAIQVLKVSSETGVEGYLKIQVDVKNQSDTSRQFSYSIEWVDGAGEVLPQVSNGFLAWMLRGHETSSIAATAPTPAATDFRLTFLAPGK